MTRYLTLLLVAIAATGIEAPAYEAALKAVLGDASSGLVMVGDNEMRCFDADLRAVVRVLASQQKKKDTEDSYSHYYITRHQADNSMPGSATVLVPCSPQPLLTAQCTEGTVDIRAPSIG